MAGGKPDSPYMSSLKFGLNAHRISAHRALTLNPRIPKITEQDALSGLRTGYANSEEATVAGYREGNRWQSNAATWLLNDFDFLVQALFAEQANIALKTHQKNRYGDHSVATLTKFERLVTIWERLLPDRQLHISGDNIKASVCGSEAYYKASDMSDGERAIFYMIGQTLTAASNSILIFDEPELHVHNSIIAKVWDELEAARQDCDFRVHHSRPGICRLSRGPRSSSSVTSTPPPPLTGPSKRFRKTAGLTRKSQLLYSAADGQFSLSKVMRIVLIRQSIDAAFPTGPLFRGDLAETSSTPL